MTQPYLTKQDLLEVLNSFKDEFVLIVKQGFDSVDERFDRVEMRLGNLEGDVSDIKLRLDQCAYRFELVELERRVEILETK